MQWGLSATELWHAGESTEHITSGVRSKKQSRRDGGAAHATGKDGCAGW